MVGCVIFSDGFFWRNGSRRSVDLDRDGDGFFHSSII